MHKLNHCIQKLYFGNSDRQTDMLSITCGVATEYKKTGLKNVI